MPTVTRALLLAALLLPQEGLESALTKFQDAWGRQDVGELLPLVDAVIRRLPADPGTLDAPRCRWMIDVLLRGGRLATLERLEAILEGKGDERSKLQAMDVRGERIAATGDLAAIRAHLATKPPAGENRTYFLERVHKAGKLRALIDALLETPVDHADFRFHAEVLRGLPWNWLPNSERNEMSLRLREKECGPEEIPALDRIRIAIQLADELKFEAALARAREILAGKVVLTGAERSWTEQVQARCHIEAADTAAALAACGRARAASSSEAFPVWLLEARARLGGGDPGGAVHAWRQAFEAARGIADAENRYRQVLWLGWNVREELRRWPDQQGPVVGACGTGDLFVLAVAREAGGDLAGAAEALDFLHVERPGQLATELERVRVNLAAGKPAKAVAARLGLSALEAAVVDRKKSPRLEGIKDLDGAILASCEEGGAWDALKEFGLHLAGQPGWHIRFLVEILEAVREPDYLDAVERAGLAAATTEGERWWAVEPVILACHRLGRDEETQRRLGTVTLDRGFSQSTMELAWSWRNDFARPEVKYRDPLEELRRRSLPDDPGSFADIERGFDAKTLDRSWRAALRAGGDALALRLGARRGRPAERFACLERIVAEPGSAGAWAGPFAALLLQTGPVERLAALIRSDRHRAAVGEALELIAPRLNREWKDALIREFDAVGACGYVWTLRGKAPDSLEERLAPLERWRSRASSEDERRRAGEELAKVAEACARNFLKAGAGLPDALRVGVALLRAGCADADAVRQRVRSVIDAAGADFWKHLRTTPWPALAPADDAELRRDILQLGREELDARAEAQRRIRAAGISALPLLLERIDDPDLELRGRVRDLILQAFLAPLPSVGPGR